MAPSIGIGFMVGPIDFVFEAYQKAVGSVLVDISRVVLVLGLGYFGYSSGWTAVETTWAMYGGQLANYALTWAIGLVIVSERQSLPAASGPVGDS
jgi:hypothetical protein